MRLINNLECLSVAGASYSLGPSVIVLNDFDGTSGLLKIFNSDYGVTFYGFDSQNSKIEFIPISIGYMTTSSNCTVTEVEPNKFNWGAFHNDYLITFI